MLALFAFIACYCEHSIPVNTILCELLDLRVKPVSGRCGVVGLVSWSLAPCFEDLVDSDLKDVEEFGVSVAVPVRDLKNMERLWESSCR